MTLCDCNNGLYFDRYCEGKKACPACDSELGEDVKTRKENYKKLMSTPIPNLAKELFK
jgi:uncharacterized protein (DUF983 family)